MNFKKIPIDEATEDQLRNFGRDTLGLTLPPNCKPETLRSKIAAAWDKDFISLPVDTPDNQAVPAGSAPLPVTDEQAPPKPGYKRIHISVTEDAAGNEPVPVGVNGKVMLIPRGKDVDIPDAYFEVLNNAVTWKYDPLPDGGINPKPREVRVYPIQRVA